MIDAGVILGAVRSGWATTRWWLQRPEARAHHRKTMKAEIDGNLPRSADDRDFRGDAAIRDVLRDRRYPEYDDGFSRGPSPWFETEVKGIYDRGLEVYVSIERVRIEGDTARPVREGGQKVAVVGRIPFERIATVDWVGDPASESVPHFYCRYGWRRRGPVKEVVLYRQGSLSLVMLEGVKYQPERISRSEMRRARREHFEQTAPAREQMARARRAWLEQGQEDAPNDPGAN